MATYPNLPAPDGSQPIKNCFAGTKAFAITTLTTGSTVVIPALAGQRFYINAIMISLSETATTASASTLKLQLQDGSTTIWNGQTSVPATATPLAGGINLLTIAGLGYVSQAANQALNINLSEALLDAANSVGLMVTIFGGYTINTP